MNILYCGDKNISDGLVISVLSLAAHTKEPLNIYILTVNLTVRLESGERVCEALPRELADTLDARVKQVNSASSVKLFDVTSLFTDNLPVANLETRFTPCCMLRLYADLVPELPDKILYLDNDVVCRKNFDNFYNTNMDGMEIAGVLDYYGSWFFRRRIFARDYLNSGVLLLNMAEIRRTGLFSRCRSRCIGKKMFMPDQSALNKLSDSKIILPRIYNEQRKLHKNTVFQHFTTSFRFFPWLHAVSVKPWQIEKMHDVLGIHEYDSLLEESRTFMTDYQKTLASQ